MKPMVESKSLQIPGFPSHSLRPLGKVKPLVVHRHQVQVAETPLVQQRSDVLRDELLLQFGGPAHAVEGEARNFPVRGFVLRRESP